MKDQRLLVIVTVFNILLLVFSLDQSRAVVARGVPPYDAFLNQQPLTV